jgi:hypothetical protein
VLNVLLEAIGASDRDDDDMESTGESSGSDLPESDEEGAGDAESNNVDHGCRRNPADDRSDHDEGDCDEEEEEDLDPGRLQSLLEEDGGDFELEHHEGADAALAHLIHSKQEARKAGQVALQRDAVRNQIRCVVLLEALVAGKNPGRGRVLSPERCLQVIERTLALRKALERSLEDRSSQSCSSLVNESKDLLERVSALLINRLFRSKFLTGQWDPSVDASDVTSRLCSRLTVELRGRASKEQRHCTNLALMSVLRATANGATQLRLASSAYGEAVLEWSGKRTTRVESTVFEELIEHDAYLAQSALVLPLSRTLCSARTPFLKAECCRLLAKLYSIKGGRGSTSINASVNGAPSQRQQQVREHASIQLEDALASIVEFFVALLRDKEIRKAKRLREVLRSVSAIAGFATSSPLASSAARLSPTLVSSLIEALEDVQTAVESSAVRGQCEKLVPKLSKLKYAPITGINKEKEGAGKHKGDGEEETDTGAYPTASEDLSRRVKTKKKKGKR